MQKLAVIGLVFSLIAVWFPLSSNAQNSRLNHLSHRHVSRYHPLRSDSSNVVAGSSITTMRPNNWTNAQGPDRQHTQGIRYLSDHADNPGNPDNIELRSSLTPIFRNVTGAASTDHPVPKPAVSPTAESKQLWQNDKFLVDPSTSTLFAPIQIRKSRDD